jgi:hypothetical protein
MTYYVYIENFNTKKIEKYNVLNEGIIKEIKEQTKGFTNKTHFAEVVNNIMRYYFWARSEYEVVLTSWPSYITSEELDRLNEESKKYQKEYGKRALRQPVNLTVEEKIDIYDQVKMNWNIFIDYVWENLR